MSLFSVFAMSGGYSAYQLLMAKYEKDILIDGNTLSDSTNVHTLNNIRSLIKVTRMKDFFEPPRYITQTTKSGTTITTPVNSKPREEEKTLMTVIQFRDEQQSKFRYDILDIEYPKHHENTIQETYINDMRDFRTILKQSNIQPNAVPAIFPMKMYSVQVKPEMTFYTSNKCAVIGSNLNQVAKHIAHARRLQNPLFVMSTFLACMTGGVLVLNKL